MNNYTIRVESNNPEFEVSERLQEGVQVEGFILLGIRNDKPYMETMYGMSIDDLAKFWATDTKMCYNLRRAAAIGEGYRASNRIGDEEKRENMRESMDCHSLAKMLIEMGADTGEDEAGQ